MSLESERREYYQKRLNQILQNATQHIRSYHNEWTTLKRPQLIEQTQNLWELSQRYRLVSGSNSTAGIALLTACQEVFEAIYETILQLAEDLNELAKDVKDFRLECQSMELEQNENLCHSLVEWNNWLENILNVYQTQTKYMELNVQSMLPKVIEDSTVEQFKKDLELPEKYMASICLGLAKAEIKPIMLMAK